jgi:surface polysaccharide O-acyltransferase-like enzyme
VKEHYIGGNNMSQQLALTKRNPSIDYVKVWASFSVISIHFRLNVQEMIPIETFGKWSSLFFCLIAISNA